MLAKERGEKEGVSSNVLLRGSCVPVPPSDHSGTSKLLTALLHRLCAKQGMVRMSLDGQSGVANTPASALDPAGPATQASQWVGTSGTQGVNM